MDQITQFNFEEAEIDLYQCFKLFAKRKNTFFGVFLLICAIGFGCILFSPRIYRISVLLQVPSIGGE